MKLRTMVPTSPLCMLNHLVLWDNGAPLRLSDLSSLQLLSVKSARDQTKLERFMVETSKGMKRV